MANSPHSPASLAPTLYKCACVCVCVCAPGGVAMPSGQRARFAAVCNYETMQWLRMSSVRVCVSERGLHTCECVCDCVCTCYHLSRPHALLCAWVCMSTCVWGTRIFETFLIGRKCRPSRSFSLRSAAALSLDSVRGHCASPQLEINITLYPSAATKELLIDRNNSHTHTHTHTDVRLEGESHEQPFNTQLHFD